PPPTPRTGAGTSWGAAPLGVAPLFSRPSRGAGRHPGTEFQQMSLKDFTDTLPDHARDLRLNMSSLLADQTFGDDNRKWGLVLACAHGTGYRPIVAAAEAEIAGKIDEAYANAARAAAAIMAMNNVYYRFVHLASNPIYQTLPAKL